MKRTNHELTLPVAGMTCASCAAHIEKALLGVPGVAQANVNLATERATVQFANGNVEPDLLVNAVRDAGYDAPTEMITLPIGGMTCASCAAHVEGALSDVTGVISANVNLATERASVSFVPGLVVILFGLSTLGVIKIPFLNYDTRPEWRDPSRNGFLASLLMGLFFAAGWTPCVGTTLGAILTMGFNRDTTAQGMILASGYAFGLGLPFLGMGLGMDQAAQSLFGRVDFLPLTLRAPARPRIPRLPQRACLRPPPGKPFRLKLELA